MNCKCGRARGCVFLESDSIEAAAITDFFRYACMGGSIESELWQERERERERERENNLIVRLTGHRFSKFSSSRTGGGQNQ